MKSLKIILFVFCLTAVEYSQIYNPLQINFIAINHASFIITFDSLTVYVDPVQDTSVYKTYPKPNIILVTDIHQDHFNPDVINSFKIDDPKIIAPKVVVDQLGYGNILNNGENIKINEVTIEAIPMYNLTEGRLAFHERGRGNGYVVTINNERIYISGDTEDIKEMRELKNIDYAFVCMNLPYTMTVEQAASATLEFKPKVIYPYHFRGKDGFSDIEKFNSLISVDKNIEIRLLNWYKWYPNKIV